MIVLCCLLAHEPPYINLNFKVQSYYLTKARGTGPVKMRFPYSCPKLLVTLACIYPRVPRGEEPNELAVELPSESLRLALKDVGASPLPTVTGGVKG